MQKIKHSGYALISFSFPRTKPYKGLTCCYVQKCTSVFDNGTVKILMLRS